MTEKKTSITRRLKDVTTLSNHVTALTEVTREDLANPENVKSIVVEAVKINDRVKQYKEVEGNLKNHMKGMFSAEIEQGQKVTLYDFDHGKKVTVSSRGSSVEVDDEGLLKALYAHYGEQEGDKTGKAWEAWMAATYQPERKVTPDRLQKLTQDNPELLKVAQEVTSIKPGSATFSVRDMTNGEQTAHQKGTLTETMVVS